MDQQTFGAETETVVRIPLERIVESANNPRKTYSESGLAELAASVAALGVQSPIVVRELPASVFKYEIVFGHRRFRASIRAKLEDIPAIVRQLSDEEADKARLHENLEREDVHYVEEAEAMHRLMAEHGMKAGELMEQTGLSSTTLYARMKLAVLHPKMREACVAGQFGREVAMRIARWPLAAQPAAMAACLDHDENNTKGSGKTGCSDREARVRLRNVGVPLQRAEFDVNDAELRAYPEGSCHACTTCPANSSRDPELAKTFSEPTCLHRACFAVKTEQHQAREIADADAAGRVLKGRNYGDVMSDKSLVHASNWIGRGTVLNLIDEAKAKGGIELPKPFLFLTPGGDAVNARFFDRKEAIAMKHKLYPEDAEAEGQAAGSTKATAPPDWRQFLSPAEKAIAYGDSWLRVKAAMAKRALVAPRVVDDIRMIVQREYDLAGELDSVAEALIGWPDHNPDDPDTDRRTLIARTEPDKLAAVLVISAINELETVQQQSDEDSAMDHIGRCLALAKRLGVDVLAAAQPPAAPPTTDPTPGTTEVRASVGAAPANPTKGGGGAARYRNTSTGEAWSGKGLQPKWLKAALAAGRSLDEFDVQRQAQMAIPSDDAASGGEEQTDDGRVAAGSDAEVGA